MTSAAKSATTPKSVLILKELQENFERTEQAMKRVRLAMEQIKKGTYGNNSDCR